MMASCATNVDLPETFPATVTAIGEADRASADSGECTIGEAWVAPNDEMYIFGDRGGASTNSVLEAHSIDQNSDGAGTCTYTAHFDEIPANQRKYDIYVNNYEQQTFTSEELKKGATYRLRPSTPAHGGAGTDVQDSDGLAPGDEYSPAPR